MLKISDKTKAVIKEVWATFLGFLIIAGIAGFYLFGDFFMNFAQSKYDNTKMQECIATGGSYVECKTLREIEKRN